MVTFLAGCLAYLAICVGCGVLVAVMDKLDRLHERRAKRRRARRVDPLKLAGRPLVDCPGDVWHGLPYAPGVGPEPDPVEQAFADTVGFALDVVPAPADDELPTVDEATVDALVLEIGRAQIRHRFKGIYGEDGQP